MTQDAGGKNGHLGKEQLRKSWWLYYEQNSTSSRNLVEKTRERDSQAEPSWDHSPLWVRGTLCKNAWLQPIRSNHCSQPWESLESLFQATHRLSNTARKHHWHQGFEHKLCPNIDWTTHRWTVNCSTSQVIPRKSNLKTWSQTPTAQVTKDKINAEDNTNIKNFYVSKDTIQVKRQPRGENFCKLYRW